MEIKEIADKNQWEEFLEKCEEKTFLNSWNWGEFNKKMGNKIWRWGIWDRSRIVSVCLIIKVASKRGTFLLIPHGPNVLNEEAKNMQLYQYLIGEIKMLADKENVDFIRISPILEGDKENYMIFQNIGFREAPLHIYPEVTWELDITKSEDELLQNMRKTTRYLIRQATKNKDLFVEEKNDLVGVEAFNLLYQQTKERHQFTPFSLEYLKNEFLTFVQDSQVKVLLVRYKKEIVAGGIFIYWQGIGFYHHGASSLQYPKIPASYLLLWEAIKRGKELGCKKFNFWGITLSQNPKHPWAGLTLFKKGFGGHERIYVKTQDLPIRIRYWLCFLIEKIRRMKRGL